MLNFTRMSGYHAEYSANHMYGNSMPSKLTARATSPSQRLQVNSAGARGVVTVHGTFRAAAVETVENLCRKNFVGPQITDVVEIVSSWSQLLAQQITELPCLHLRGSSDCTRYSCTECKRRSDPSSCSSTHFPGLHIYMT